MTPAIFSSASSCFSRSEQQIYILNSFGLFLPHSTIQPIFDTNNTAQCDLSLIGIIQCFKSKIFVLLKSFLLFSGQLTSLHSTGSQVSIAQNCESIIFISQFVPCSSKYRLVMMLMISSPIHKPGMIYLIPHKLISCPITLS